MKVIKAFLVAVINVLGTISKFLLVGVFHAAGRAGSRPAGPPEYCPRCKQMVTKYDMMATPDGIEDKRWCVTCINIYTGRG